MASVADTVLNHHSLRVTTTLRVSQGGFPPSFIHQVIIITGLTKL